MTVTGSAKERQGRGKLRISWRNQHSNLCHLNPLVHPRERCRHTLVLCLNSQKMAIQVPSLGRICGVSWPGLYTNDERATILGCFKASMHTWVQSLVLVWSPDSPKPKSLSVCYSDRANRAPSHQPRFSQQIVKLPWVASEKPKLLTNGL